MEALVANDRPVAEIATAIGISEPTLRGHYAAELTAARPQINLPFAESPNPPAQRAASSAPSRAGRPEHVPTAEARERVEIWVASGMTGRQIAIALGVSEPTLLKHYETELSQGGARKVAAMKERLFQAGMDGNVAAMKAFLSTFRLDVPDPGAKEPQLGKKEQALADARQPSVTTALGELMARRHGLMN